MTAGAGTLASHLAATLLDPGAAVPAGLRVWDGSDPAPRLAVHRNNVTVSLVDALSEVFPVSQALVGEDFFRAMATVFVRVQPPRSRVLAAYGADLPAFIADFAPARPVPALADVARLEWARQRGVHAADAPLLDAAEVSDALAGGERPEHWRLVCQPSVAVLASDFAMVSIWAAHQLPDEAARDAALAAVDAHLPESALVVRQDDEVAVLRLLPGADAFVAALQQGLRLAEAAGQALRQSADFDLSGALALLHAQGALTALQRPQEDAP